MIPKIIHYCWFGRTPKSDNVMKYISTWKTHLSDYKIIEWNETNFDFNRFHYTREAYLVRKFAFVSDVARLQALYNYGGIYFDTDILVLKNFDDLLSNKSFIGYEADTLPGTGVIAAEKNCQWILDFLKIYETLSFISYKGRLDLTPNTIRLKKSNILGGCLYDNKNVILENNIHIYPFDYFCAKDFLSKKIKTTERTYCIHDYQSSWMQSTNLTLMARLRNLYYKFL